jgi:DNA mismatch repair protein MutS
LAGVPGAVIERGKQILAQLENEQLESDGGTKLAAKAKRIKTSDLQLTLFAAEEHPLVDEVRRIDLDATTPLEAHTRLAAWQARLKNDRK